VCDCHVFMCSFWTRWSGTPHGWRGTRRTDRVSPFLGLCSKMRFERHTLTRLVSELVTALVTVLVLVSVPLTTHPAPLFLGP
jgi:hypothetical protein